jgi:transposase-like protein
MTPEKMTLITNIQAIASRIDQRIDVTKIFPIYEKKTVEELRASQDEWLEKYHVHLMKTNPTYRNNEN